MNSMLIIKSETLDMFDTIQEALTICKNIKYSHITFTFDFSKFSNGDYDLTINIGYFKETPLILISAYKYFYYSLAVDNNNGCDKTNRVQDLKAFIKRIEDDYYTFNCNDFDSVDEYPVDDLPF